MMDFEIITHFGIHKVFVSKIKYFHVKNFNIKRGIINALDGYFSKEKESEFAVEMNLTSKIFSDGKLVNVNDFDYYKISDSFDLKTELKLGSKSLLFKYIEVKTDKLEYMDSYQTLRYIIQDIEEEIGDFLLEDIKSLNFNFCIDLEKKQLLKLIIPTIMKGNLSANIYDITYDELILLQLELLMTITKSIQKKAIIVIDIPLFKAEWLKRLELFSENVYLFLFNQNIIFDIPAREIYISNDKYSLDLYDDNSIFELCLEENNNFTVEEYRNYLVNQLINK